jgi:hypothetical protein
MARGPIASHPVIASEVYHQITGDNPALINKVRATFYRALQQDPFFKNMRKRGDLKYEPMPGHGPGRPSTRWHFSEDGARHATKWLNKKFKVTNGQPKREGPPEGMGNNLYRLCSSLGIEPVFDGITINVEMTLDKLAKNLV